MTRKHYEAVAGVIRAELGDGLDLSAADRMRVPRIQSLVHVARGLADVFEADNSRFDRGRFLTACGLGE